MALPALNGSWQVSYFKDPERMPSSTYCFNFSTVANSIANEPLSGTWQEAATPSWQGNWIQQGDQVKWWGTIASLQYVTAHQGAVITLANTPSVPGAAGVVGMTGHYQSFPVVGGPGIGSIDVGAWSAQKVASC
jgi:hypothetical protein